LPKEGREEEKRWPEGWPQSVLRPAGYEGRERGKKGSKMGSFPSRGRACIY